jgi:hypothetical protein
MPNAFIEMLASLEQAHSADLESLRWRAWAEESRVPPARAWQHPDALVHFVCDADGRWLPRRILSADRKDEGTPPWHPHAPPAPGCAAPTQEPGKIVSYGWDGKYWYVTEPPEGKLTFIDMYARTKLGRDIVWSGRPNAGTSQVSVKDAATKLMVEHVKDDPNIEAIYLIEDASEIRLLEITTSVPSTGDVLAVRFPSDSEVPYKSLVVLLNPKDWERQKTLEWPIDLDPARNKVTQIFGSQGSNIPLGEMIHFANIHGVWRHCTIVSIGGNTKIFVTQPRPGMPTSPPTYPVDPKVKLVSFVFGSDRETWSQIPYYDVLEARG